jgi:hypothetical protein
MAPRSNGSHRMRGCAPSLYFQSPVGGRRTLSATFSPEDIARMKADLAVLEKAHDSVSDTGIREIIRVWIEDAKKTLAAAEAERSSSVAIPAAR